MKRSGEDTEISLKASFMFIFARSVLVFGKHMEPTDSKGWKFGSC